MKIKSLNNGSVIFLLGCNMYLRFTGVTNNPKVSKDPCVVAKKKGALNTMKNLHEEVDVKLAT